MGGGGLQTGYLVEQGARCHGGFGGGVVRGGERAAREAAPARPALHVLEGEGRLALHQVEATAFGAFAAGVAEKLLRGRGSKGVG